MTSPPGKARSGSVGGTRESSVDPRVLAPDDRGFLLGDGIFETLRVYRGVPFRLEAHLRRLAQGAEILGLPVPSDLAARIDALLEKAAAGTSVGRLEASLRITLSRGRGGELGGDGADGPTAALRLTPLPGGRSGRPPLSAVIAGRLHEEALSAGLKGIGYLERILALRQARERGADDALLLNARDELVEGTASNLLAVLPGALLVAPGRREGALPGITREVVLDAAPSVGLEVQERGLGRDELPRVRELLLTSSIREVAPVVRVEGGAVGEGRPGPIGKRLQKALRAAIERETT